MESGDSHGPSAWGLEVCWDGGGRGGGAVLPTHSTQAVHPRLHSPGGKFQSLVMKGITCLGSWSFPGSSKIEIFLDALVGNFPGRTGPPEEPGPLKCGK